MRMTLTHKFVGSLLIALSICALVVLWVSIHFMKEPLEEELDNNIRALQNVVRTANDQTASRFAQSAMLVSNDEALARAIRDRNHEEVMRLSQRAMKESGSDFMTVTDEKGTVVGRGHSKKFKDSVLNQETVVKALEGTPAAAIVAGTVVPFTIRASQPVKLDGKLVGTLSIGTSLVTPPYLDWLKNMTGRDITIYKGNERVMTTIMKDGQRIVGTKLDDPASKTLSSRKAKRILPKTRSTGRITNPPTGQCARRTARLPACGLWARRFRLCANMKTRPYTRQFLLLLAFCLPCFCFRCSSA